MTRHGPHQGAHASISTGTGDGSTIAVKFWSVSTIGLAAVGRLALHFPQLQQQLPAPRLPGRVDRAAGLVEDYLERLVLAARRRQLRDLDFSEAKIGDRQATGDEDDPEAGLVKGAGQYRSPPDVPDAEEVLHVEQDIGALCFGAGTGGAELHGVRQGALRARLRLSIPFLVTASPVIDVGSIEATASM